MSKTRDFTQVIRQKLNADRRLRSAVEKERLNAAIATLILEARTQAKLTQKELADLAGTHQSVIARLEDADYRGHSLSMLQRIATALGRQLTVDFQPRRQKKRPA